MSLGEIAHPSDVDTAHRYLSRLVGHERAAGGRDLEGALRAVGRRTGIGFWSLWGLYNRRRKQPGAGLMARLRAAYLKFLSDQIGVMTAELERERRLGRADDDLEAISVEVSALQARLAEARRVWVSPGASVL